MAFPLNENKILLIVGFVLAGGGAFIAFFTGICAIVFMDSISSYQKNHLTHLTREKLTVPGTFYAILLGYIILMLLLAAQCAYGCLLVMGKIFKNRMMISIGAIVLCGGIFVLLCFIGILQEGYGCQTVAYKIVSTYNSKSEGRFLKLTELERMYYQSTPYGCCCASPIFSFFNIIALAALAVLVFMNVIKTESKMGELELEGKSEPEGQETEQATSVMATTEPPTPATPFTPHGDAASTKTH